MEEKIIELDRILSGLEETESLFGSFLIKKDGEIMYQKIIGYRDIVDGIPVYADNQTKYRIASITKTFTSVMIQKAIEMGLIQYDTTLDAFFPLIQNAEKITIHDMLYHRSGLYDYINDPQFRVQYDESHLMRTEMLEVIYNSKHLRPNSRTKYSNTNYVLLGYILEDLYQKTYNDLLKEMITDVIGLQNTSYAETISVENNESRSFIYENGFIPAEESNLSWGGGASAIISTTEDTALFYESLFNGKLLKKDSLEHMIDARYKLVKDTWLGMGIMKLIMNDKNIYSHDGRIGAFQSLILYDPNEKITIAGFVNGGSRKDIDSMSSLNGLLLGWF
ncbi:MAG: beta-lactamase family protein [Spirochaetaceae bacterium]|jgi:CubicO group peptidase (beta-lactamase class C family)|nr:beta-lactamase family protein [Spirochaetaceae bacterium]